jgi:hypothetical protein
MRKKIRKVVLACLVFAACQNQHPKVETIVASPKAPSSTLKDSTSSVSKPNPLPLTDKKIRFLWMESVHDPQKQYANQAGNIMVSRVNDVFLKIMSEPEKAALAYIATFGDSGDCDPSAECETGIKCQISTALNLGCQCSKTYLEFLHQWFAPKTDVFEEGHCYQRPMTASRRILFSEINLAVKGRILTVTYEGNGTTGEEGWEFKGTNIFQFNETQLVIIDSKHALFNSKKYEH